MDSPQRTWIRLRSPQAPITKVKKTEEAWDSLAEAQRRQVLKSKKFFFASLASLREVFRFFGCGSAALGLRGEKVEVRKVTLTRQRVRQ
jgi:hypothetical protein